MAVQKLADSTPKSLENAPGSISRSSAPSDSEERARQLASIVESSDDSIVATDLERRITSWNRGAARLFGYTAEEAIGMSISVIVTGQKHDEELAIFERFQRGERVEPFDTVRRHKDGTLIDVSLSVSPIRNLDGKIVGACSVTRDITERKRTEERVALLAREAEHRTRNVLQAVQTVVHLSRAQTPEELKAVIQGRVKALANAHSLLAEARWVGADLVRLASQELVPYLQEERSRARIEGPHVPVQPNVAQGMSIIFHELATNAAKYGALSKLDGHVEIKWVCDSDDRLLLTWSETGGPIIAEPTRRGVGTRLIETLVQRDFGGEIRFNWRAEGLVCEIELAFR